MSRHTRLLAVALIASVVTFILVPASVAAVSTSDVTGEIILEEGREMAIGGAGAIEVTFSIAPGESLEVTIEADPANGNKIIR